MYRYLCVYLLYMYRYKTYIMYNDMYYSIVLYYCVYIYVLNQASGRLPQLGPGATYAHPRELLSTLGHSCLCLTQHPADQWLVREALLHGWFVRSCGSLAWVVGFFFLPNMYTMYMGIIIIHFGNPCYPTSKKLVVCGKMLFLLMVKLWNSDASSCLLC